MVAKDSFDTESKGKMTSCSSMEQAVGGLRCLSMLVLTHLRLREVIFVVKESSLLGFLELWHGTGDKKHTLEHREVINKLFNNIGLLF